MKRLTTHLKDVVEIIRSGGLVAYPTESFYGLAANVASDKALDRLFEVKGRNANQPILLLIPDNNSLNRYVTHVPEVALRLMDAFWPGGLTIIFEAHKHLSTHLTAGTGKIGLRLSSHPLATGLARAMGSAITGTSANISGKPPCSTPREVLEGLGERVDIVLDGGKTPGEKPSTVVDITTLPVTLLREGIVSREMLEPHCDQLI